MKRILLIGSLTILLLSSCTTVKFESSQPKDTAELKEFPANLTGIYLASETDSLTITKNSFQYGNKKSLNFNMDKVLTPGETVLKKLNDYYVLSLRDENAWEVIAFQTRGTDITVYYINVDKDNANKTIDKLKKIAPVKEIKDKEGKIDYYLMNPSKSEFEALLKQEIFTNIGEFNKIK